MEKQLSPTQVLTTQISTQIGEKLKQVWTGEGDVETFLVKAVNAIVSNDKLKQCSRPSLYLALLDAATSGLNVDGVEGALVPYGKTANFQPMFHGLAKRAKWQYYKVFVVREKDHWKYIDTNEGCQYEFAKARGDRGEFEMAVCFSIHHDGYKSITVIAQDVMKGIEDKAKSKNPVWKSNREAMWQKTAAKQHAKYQVFEDMSIIKMIQNDDILEEKDITEQVENEEKMTKAERTAQMAIEQEAVNE